MSESAASQPYYTFEDWCNLPESVRAELYDGKISMMAFPIPAHQSISRELTLQIGGFLKGKQCTFFAAPIGVKLFDDKDTVVSPDALVICDSSKIGSKVIEGAPDFVIEIMSTSTYRYDVGEKMVLYQRAGVKEYWIINVDAKSILACTLVGDEYRMRIYSLGAGDKLVPVSTLPDLTIDLAVLFENIG